MKEASGELNLTVITVIAIAAVAAFFAAILPRIKSSINDQWDRSVEEGEKSITYIIRSNTVR